MGHERSPERTDQQRLVGLYSRGCVAAAIPSGGNTIFSRRIGRSSRTSNLVHPWLRHNGPIRGPRPEGMPIFQGTPNARPTSLQRRRTP